MAEAMTATGQPMCPHTTGLFFPWKQGTRSPAAPARAVPLTAARRPWAGQGPVATLADLEREGRGGSFAFVSFPFYDAKVQYC